MSAEKKQITDADRLANLQAEAQTERNMRVKAEADAKRWEERFDNLLRLTMRHLSAGFDS